MTTITAKIVLDSVSPKGHRLTTLQLRFPRIILAEFNTHRVFSRNASSSRAIPFSRLVREVREDPFVPVHWGANRPGMQASEEVSLLKIWAARKLWLGSMWVATSLASVMSKIGVHKQVVNRLIEPWAHVNVLVTSTDYSNFLKLRDHPDAQPEIHELAIRMREALEASVPLKREIGQYHLPYVSLTDALDLSEEKNPIKYHALVTKVSVARCARVSYKLHDGSESSIEKDLELYEKLVGSEPLHASPAEHQAQVTETEASSGNFGVTDWLQYRKHLERVKNPLNAGVYYCPYVPKNV